MNITKRVVIGISLVAAFAPALALADAPTANSLSVSTIQGNATTTKLIGVATSTGDTLTFATSSNPTHGTLGAIGSDGSFTYTPDSSYVGTDAFTYNVSENGVASPDATVSISVSAAPDTTPPVFSSLSNHIYIATSSFSVMPQSAYPTATDNVDPHPVITYSPTSLSAGTSTVTWTATDASGNSVATTSSVVIVTPLQVDVPAQCTVTDTNAVAHAFPTSGSSTTYSGICMLEAAKEAGLLSDVQFKNSSFGLFVQSINGKGTDTNPSLALWNNEVSSPVGITDISLVQGDIVSFVLTDYSAYPVFTESDIVALQAHSLIATTTSSGGGGGGGGGGGSGPTHGTFDLNAAVSFVSSKQNADGSFDSSLYSDWAAIAFAAADLSTHTAPSAAETKLRKYLLTANPAMSSVTDYERHAMALEALNINPYSGTPNNYISPIIAAFDGTQIGDPSLDNDDIFSVIPLTQAGYSAGDPLIQKEVLYIMSKQLPDGSWDESPDMTAAAIQAVGPFFTMPHYPQVMGAAAGYLLSTQQTAGGWGTAGVTNIDSTSWVQTAINAIPTDPAHGGISWVNAAGHVPMDAIASAQQTDGAVRPVADAVNNRVWSTSYAITAASGQSWLSALQLFPQPAPTSGSGSSGGTNTATPTTLTATSTNATSTTAIATSTSPIATSTSSIAPSTPTLSVPVISATTSQPQTLPKQKHLPVHLSTAVISVPHNPPAVTPNSTQTAAAAATGHTGENFFGTMWNAITSFFAHLF